MSGIYIPGMGAPKDCPMCPLSHWTWGGVFRGCDIVSGKKHAMDDPEYASSNKRPEWCPLIPVPEHGDLVERQAVLNTFSIHMNRTLHFVTIRDAVPTIIPADHIGDVNEMVTDKEGDG